MASVSYDEIFSVFLSSITDYKIASLDPNDATELMLEFMHESLAELYLTRIFSSIDHDDMSQTLTYSLKNSVDEASDKKFVINALAKWMVYEWLHNQVRSVLNTAQFFGGAEQRYFSQANHLAEIRALMEDAYKEARTFIQERGYIIGSQREG